MPYHANDLIDLINLGMPLTGNLLFARTGKIFLANQILFL